MMEVHEIIKALQPYNLSKLAKEIGVHRATLYRMVNEHTQPSPLLHEKLSDYLGGGDDDE